jgi:poly-gamma-glutamate synthesis protein (capsule biosynthesis protein)
MHPRNVACLQAARLDVCVLANNHVLDWGYGGLAETLGTLHAAGIRTAGAGNDAEEAEAPAQFPLREGRVLVFAWAMESSGVPREWAAGPQKAGVNLLGDLSASSAGGIAAQVARHRRAGDIVVASIHWGGNWGYDVSRAQREFGRRLIDAGVDVVHGHSSHHPRGMEMHAGRPILHGCGDFLNDYEGIEGMEAYRGDLCFMYFVDVAPGGGAATVELVPMRIRRMRLERAAEQDAAWLRDCMARECERLGAHPAPSAHGGLRLHG